MKNNINSKVVIAILALVATCVSIALILNATLGSEVHTGASLEGTLNTIPVAVGESPLEKLSGVKYVVDKNTTIFALSEEDDVLTIKADTYGLELPTEIGATYFEFDSSGFGEITVLVKSSLPLIQVLGCNESKCWLEPAGKTEDDVLHFYPDLNVGYAISTESFVELAK